MSSSPDASVVPIRSPTSSVQSSSVPVLHSELELLESIADESLEGGGGKEGKDRSPQPGGGEGIPEDEVLVARWTKLVKVHVSVDCASAVIVGLSKARAI